MTIEIRRSYNFIPRITCFKKYSEICEAEEVAARIASQTVTLMTIIPNGAKNKNIKIANSVLMSRQAKRQTPVQRKEKEPEAEVSPDAEAEALRKTAGTLSDKADVTIADMALANIKELIAQSSEEGVGELVTQSVRPPRLREGKSVIVGQVQVPDPDPDAEGPQAPHFLAPPVSEGGLPHLQALTNAPPPHFSPNASPPIGIKKVVA
jgi:hypothetical protein